jgi:hypothetical protein
MFTKTDLRQHFCDHSQGAGIALVETFMKGRNRLMFMCINCKACVMLPDKILDKARN